MTKTHANPLSTNANWLWMMLKPVHSWFNMWTFPILHVHMHMHLCRPKDTAPVDRQLLHKQQPAVESFPLANQHGEILHIHLWVNTGFLWHLYILRCFFFITNKFNTCDLREKVTFCLNVFCFFFILRTKQCHCRFECLMQFSCWSIGLYIFFQRQQEVKWINCRDLARC